MNHKIWLLRPACAVLVVITVSTACAGDTDKVTTESPEISQVNTEVSASANSTDAPLAAPDDRVSLRSTVDYILIKDLPALAEKSDRVVTARVVALGTSFDDVPPGVTVAKDLPANKVGIPMNLSTPITFEVEQTISPDSTSGGTITIVAPGGSNEKFQRVVDTNPLPIVGERYLMFLRLGKDPRYQYSIVGGPQGRYILREGNVVGDKDATGEVGVSASLIGRPLDVVAAEVRQLMASDAK
jgi:hypothetical protein